MSLTMPIRKSSTVARRSALKLFSDREDECELIRDFFSRLARMDARAAKPILSFWGAGRIGKTSLLKQAAAGVYHRAFSLRIMACRFQYGYFQYCGFALPSGTPRISGERSLGG